MGSEPPTFTDEWRIPIRWLKGLIWLFVGGVVAVGSSHLALWLTAKDTNGQLELTNQKLGVIADSLDGHLLNFTNFVRDFSEMKVQVITNRNSITANEKQIEALARTVEKLQDVVERMRTTGK